MTKIHFITSEFSNGWELQLTYYLLLVKKKGVL